MKQQLSTVGILHRREHHETRGKGTSVLGNLAAKEAGTQIKYKRNLKLDMSIYQIFSPESMERMVKHNFKF